MKTAELIALVWTDINRHPIAENLCDEFSKAYALTKQELGTTSSGGLVGYKYSGGISTLLLSFCHMAEPPYIKFHVKSETKAMCLELKAKIQEAFRAGLQIVGESYSRPK